MTTTDPFRIVDGPNHVVDRTEPSLRAWYEAEFTTPDGRGVRRYLTDKGRAELLRLLDGGRRAFSTAELRDLSVKADPRALNDRTDKESGEGA